MKSGILSERVAQKPTIAVSPGRKRRRKPWRLSAPASARATRTGDDDPAASRTSPATNRGPAVAAPAGGSAIGSAEYGAHAAAGSAARASASVAPVAIRASDARGVPSSASAENVARPPSTDSDGRANCSLKASARPSPPGTVIDHARSASPIARSSGAPHASSHLMPSVPAHAIQTLSPQKARNATSSQALIPRTPMPGAFAIPGQTTRASA